MWDDPPVTEVRPSPDPWAAPPPAPPDPPASAAERSLIRAHALGQGALTLLGLGAGLIALRAVGVHAPPCPLRALTGVPCPGCGMTRLADAVAHGHLGTALRADAAGVAILAAIVVLGLVHLVQVVRRGHPPATWMRSWLVPGVLVALAAAHWATTLVTGGLPSS